MKILSMLILGASLASPLAASELDKTVYTENASIVVSVDTEAKEETIYYVESLDMLPDEASKEDLDALVESGDAKVIDKVFEASDSEFDELSSTEAWGWYSPYYTVGWGRYGYGYPGYYGYRYARYGNLGYIGGYYGYGAYRFKYGYSYGLGYRNFYYYF